MKCINLFRVFMLITLLVVTRAGAVGPDVGVVAGCRFESAPNHRYRTPFLKHIAAANTNKLAAIILGESLSDDKEKELQGSHFFEKDASSGGWIQGGTVHCDGREALAETLKMNGFPASTVIELKIAIQMQKQDYIETVVFPPDPSYKQIFRVRAVPGGADFSILTSMFAATEIKSELRGALALAAAFNPGLALMFVEEANPMIHGILDCMLNHLQTKI